MVRYMHDEEAEYIFKQCEISYTFEREREKLIEERIKWNIKWPTIIGGLCTVIITIFGGNFSFNSYEKNIGVTLWLLMIASLFSFGIFILFFILSLWRFEYDGEVDIDKFLELKNKPISDSEFLQFRIIVLTKMTKSLKSVNDNRQLYFNRMLISVLCTTGIALSAILIYMLFI